MPYLHKSFSAKEPSGSVAENDLQLNASYESLPPCTTDCCPTLIQDAVHWESTVTHISRGVLEILALDPID